MPEEIKRRDGRSFGFVATELEPREGAMGTQISNAAITCPVSSPHSFFELIIATVITMSLATVSSKILRSARTQLHAQGMRPMTVLSKESAETYKQKVCFVYRKRPTGSDAALLLANDAS